MNKKDKVCFTNEEYKVFHNDGNLKTILPDVLTRSEICEAVREKIIVLKKQKFFTFNKYNQSLYEERIKRLERFLEKEDNGCITLIMFERRTKDEKKL